ncbi:hypothetical protein ES705_39511 [subsurface metagenome]
MDTLETIDISTKNWIQSSVSKLKESHPDDIIYAWESGVNKGMNLREKAIKKVYDDMLSKVLMTAAKMFKKLNTSLHMPCERFFVKMGEVEEFDVLFLVDLEDYLSEKLKVAYLESNKIKAECKEETFKINFIFKAFTKNTNIENIQADGFLLHYAPKPRKT